MRMRFSFAVVVLVAASTPAHANPFRFAVGGTAGGSTAGHASFPARYIGAIADAALPIVSNIEASLETRLQAYSHPEDEHFGSYGFQFDAALGVRANDGAGFLALRVGWGLLRGWPFEGNEDPCTRCNPNGLITTASIGFDGLYSVPSLRAQASVTRADLPFDDDAVRDPPWEITIAVLTMWK